MHNVVRINCSYSREEVGAQKLMTVMLIPSLFDDSHLKYASPMQRVHASNRVFDIWLLYFIAYLLGYCIIALNVMPARPISS